jgi:hypothetical protein
VSQSAVTKKVKPYPFEASLEGEGAKHSVDVVMLTSLGMIARIRQHVLYVGRVYQCVFELPALGRFVNAQVKVMKTYDRAMDVKVKTIDRMAEFHFLNLSGEHKNLIQAFTQAIGQKPK